MYIVTKVYDDDFVEVINLIDFKRYDLGVSDQRKLITETEVLGLVSYDNKIVDRLGYNFICFPTEDEAENYCLCNKLSFNNIKSVNGNFFVFIKNNKLYKVNYYVYNQVGNVITYVGHKNSYTNYKQAAKIFDRESAYIKANNMTKNSKTGKFWYVQRELIY